MADFELHPQLAKDTLLVADWPLCSVLLMNDSQYPWLVLVPRRADITEVYELAADEQAQLWAEVTAAGQQLMGYSEADKLNIAALGNMVPQLHMHVIARYRSDAAWPGPVWGVKPAEAYSAAQLEALLPILRAQLKAP